MENVKQIDELISKELDTLENAISDENRALAICSREEIWKLILKRGDLAIAERDREVVEMINKFIEEAYFHAESSGWSANNLRTGEPIKDFHTPSYNRGLDESKKIINLINSKK